MSIKQLYKLLLSLHFLNENEKLPTSPFPASTNPNITKTMSFQPPRYGVYTPVVTFFNEDETIDYDSIAQHVRRLLTSGVTGLVIHGSNGEATHLSHEERSEIIHQMRATAKQVHVTPVIIAGCSANSVRETLQHIGEAHKASADYALVLPPNYWSAAMSKSVIKSFYIEVWLSLSSPLQPH
jgi:4-hydroxy-2-oxoglutarate aldolase